MSSPASQSARNAEICSQCGSRELSTPQPKIPLLLAPLVTLLAALPGLLLLGLTIVFFLVLLSALATRPELLFQLMLVGLMLALLWYLYMQLPAFLHRLVSKLFHRSKKDDHGH